MGMAIMASSSVEKRRGCPTHDAKVGDIGRSGRISIVGKSYDPGQCVDLWLNKL